MGEALAWVGQIVEWIGQFIPRWTVVPTTSAGVKFVGGSRIVSFGAGIQWWWPARTILMTHPIARQAVVLRPQTLTTRDDRVVAVGCVLAYTVEDIELLLTQTYNPDETVEEIALGIANRVVATKTWAELQEAHIAGRLDLELRREARAALRPYGVRVRKTTLTDLAPCRVYKLLMPEGRP